MNMKEIWKDIVNFDNERRKNTELKTKRGDNFVH